MQVIDVSVISLIEKYDMSGTSNNSYLDKSKSLNNTRETRITTNELETKSSQIILASTSLTKTKNKS